MYTFVAEYISFAIKLYTVVSQNNIHTVTD